MLQITAMNSAHSGVDSTCEKTIFSGEFKIICTQEFVLKFAKTKIKKRCYKFVYK